MRCLLKYKDKTGVHTLVYSSSFIRDFESAETMCKEEIIRLNKISKSDEGTKKLLSVKLRTRNSIPYTEGTK